MSMRNWTSAFSNLIRRGGLQSSYFQFLEKSFMGFAIPKEEQDKVVKFSFHNHTSEFEHGSVVIAAITSCTNTSNPGVMLGAGLVAKKAYVSL